MQYVIWLSKHYMFKNTQFCKIFRSRIKNLSAWLPALPLKPTIGGRGANPKYEIRGEFKMFLKRIQVVTQIVGTITLV